MTKILAVDDVPQNLRLMEAVLAPNGFEVVTAGTGEDALLQVLKEKPDLVLLDIMLPGIDGYSLQLKISQDPQTPPKRLGLRNRSSPSRAPKGSSRWTILHSTPQTIGSGCLLRTRAQ